MGQSKRVVGEMSGYDESATVTGKVGYLLKQQDQDVLDDEILPTVHG
jgi:chaperonin cofactor prefoldin